MAPATLPPLTRLHPRRRCRTGRRFGALAATLPGARPAAPDRPWYGGRLPQRAAARTIAASTATITRPPRRRGCRAAILDRSGARSAALVGRSNVAAHCKRDAVRRVDAILDEPAMRIIKTFALMAVLCGTLASVPASQLDAASQTPAVAVGPQYDTTHVYVAPDDFDRFVASLVAMFGGTTSKKGEFT